MQVKQKMIDWGVLESSWIHTAITCLALKEVGIDYENLIDSEQDKLEKRVTMTTNFVRFGIEPIEPYYQVRIELFPEFEVVKRCIKEN